MHVIDRQSPQVAQSYGQYIDHPESGEISCKRDDEFTYYINCLVVNRRHEYVAGVLFSQWMNLDGQWWLDNSPDGLPMVDGPRLHGHTWTKNSSDQSDDLAEIVAIHDPTHGVVHEGPLHRLCNFPWVKTANDTDPVSVAVRLKRTQHERNKMSKMLDAIRESVAGVLGKGCPVDEIPAAVDELCAMMNAADVANEKLTAKYDELQTGYSVLAQQYEDKLDEHRAFTGKLCELIGDRKTIAATAATPANETDRTSDYTACAYCMRAYANKYIGVHMYVCVSRPAKAEAFES